MTYFEQNRERILAELIEFLKIPSISTSPEHQADVRRAADFAVANLKAAGVENAGLIEGTGNPLVYGDWLHAPGKPTLLLYGHYDVQPPDPLDEWKSPPFEPEIRGDDIFARGASDDKGQTFILMKAVEYFLKTKGALPINVQFLLEGEEEVGGEHIAEYVASKPALLKADAAVICDTELFAPGLPTLCVGLRGIVYGELSVRGADHDLHSGVYGGAAPNPIMAIAEILTALKDRDGHFHIPGFTDSVRKPTEKEFEAWSRLPFNEEEYTKKEVGAKELVGEPEYSVFERVWARPTLEVHGIRGGFTGEGAKTVIPARALAKVSMRLVADQDPEQATAQLAAAVKQVCPRGVDAEFKAIHSAAPSLVDTGNPFIVAADKALTEAFGRQTVYIRSGGSIPIAGLFDQHLGIPSVLMGFGLPDDNLHAPNEKFHLPNLFKGMEAVAAYFEVLGK